MAKKKPSVDLGSGASFERVEIASLIHDPTNARKHSAKNRSAVMESLRRFGLQRPIVVRDDNVVIAGNATLEAARRLGWTHIDIMRSRLTGEESKAYAIADNRTAELAEWDDLILSEQLELLRTTDADLALAAGFDPADLEELFDSAAEKAEKYTSKIISPVYEPNGEAPAVASLYDDSKTRELTKAIDDADIPEDIRRFLYAAAQRHTIIRFDRCADLYPHLPEELQRLFEDSALVLIDFDRAIELGFVSMHDEMLAQIRKEHPDA